jgi:hypothetical protein
MLLIYLLRQRLAAECLATTEAETYAKGLLTYTQPNCTFELTMSKLYNLVIMKKFYYKAKGTQDIVVIREG